MIQAVGHKVLKAPKLKFLVGLRLGQWRLHIRRHHLKAVGVQALQEVFAASIRMRFGKLAVVQTQIRALEKGLSAQGM